MQPAQVYQLLREAVAGKRRIAASYDGQRRLLCPHRLGWNKDGRPQVLCYQYGGESGSGLGPRGSPDNWRCLAVDRLSRVEMLDGAWETAPNHSRPQSCVAQVDVDAEDSASAC